jgi:hypothetical protein
MKDKIIQIVKILGTFIGLYILYSIVFSMQSFATINHYLGGENSFKFWNAVMWALPFIVFGILLIKSLHDWKSWVTKVTIILSGMCLVLLPILIYLDCNIINPPLKTADLLNCAFFPIRAFYLASLPVVIQITRLIFIRKANK